METIWGSCGVFGGCMSNALFLELIVKLDPGAGSLVTFSQFLFIAIKGFLASNFATDKRHIPFKGYAVVVSLFFLANACNNYAFNFNISMPLHMIFRSGSLITNMIVGNVILKKKYPLTQIISVLLITLGVTICTLVTGQEMKSSKNSDGEGVEDDFFWWLLGIAILVFSLFISAFLGHFQERLYATYGKYPSEALFYTHTLSLPVFLLLQGNIREHFSITMSSKQVNVLGQEVPILLIYLLGNVVTQYVCISSVYYLTCHASSLAVTLVITLRKFVSLLVSIVYFQNNFTLMHWFGTLCVFVGTIIFTELHKKLWTYSTGKTKKKN